MRGILTRAVKSRVSANRNMELTLLMTEQKYVLAYTLHPIDQSPHIEQDYNHDSDNEEIVTSPVMDKDRNLILSRIFAHRISKSRPD